MGLCVRTWRSKALLDDIMALRISKGKLRWMTRIANINAVYQADIQSHFEDTSVARSDQAFGTGMQPQQLHTKLPDGWKLVVTWWKYKFARSSFYSMSAALMGACQALLVEYDTDIPPGPVAALIQSIASGVVQDSDAGAGHVFFQVTNPAPEKRARVPGGHVATSRSCINIALCAIVLNDAARRELLSVSMFGTHATIDLCGLVANTPAASGVC